MFEALFKKIADNAAAIDVAGTFPENEFCWLADEGLLKIVLPNEQMDFNKPSLQLLLHLLKNIGAANLSVGRIFEGHINALQLIHVFGRPEQQHRWYNEVTDQNKLFGVWNSENGNGVEVHDLQNGRYRLHGAKMFCSGAHWVQRPLVTGKMISPHKSGWQMFVVPVEKVLAFKEDNSFWNPMGMKASASFKIDFTDIEIEEDDLLGLPDNYYKEPYFNGGAIRFTAVQLGGALAILEATHLFLKQHNRIGTDFQKARIAEMAMLAASGNNWLDAAAHKSNQWIHSPDNYEKNTAYAGMVRMAVEKICSRILYLSGVCVGPLGLMKPNVLERLHRDLTFYLRQPAPDAVMIVNGSYLFNKENIKDAWE